MAGHGLLGTGVGGLGPAGERAHLRAQPAVQGVQR
jgi:hypothetical protein